MADYWFMADSKIDTLGAIEMFRPLSDDELQHLAEVAVAKRHQPGEALFLEGEPCQGLWVIADGAARVVKTTPHGRQLVLAIQVAPATVAEVPLFDGGPYPAGLFAVQPTESLLILREDFLGLCRRNPELALRFLKVFGRRLRQLVGLAERVTFGTIRQRLAADLLERAKPAGGAVFQLEETQEQLAVRLGTVREVVSRNMSRFQSEGLLRVDRRTVEVLDRAGLEQEAETEL